MSAQFRGPSAAERFCDDMAAARALKRHDLPCPPQLELSAIASRYPATQVLFDEDDLPESVYYLDGSVALLVEYRWEVAR